MDFVSAVDSIHSLMKKLVLAGGSGFLGSLLAAHFKNSFDDIVVLARKAKPPHQNIRFAIWDGQSLGAWQAELNNADVLINLTGKNVNCRYTQKNKNEILASRLDSTRVLGAAIRAANNPPNIWIQCASSTIYEHSFEPNDENSNKIGNDFSMTVCKEWEQTFWEESCTATKKILLRTAIVLGRDGGAWPVMEHLLRFGLGGTQGTGRQMISWIHEYDFARAVEWLLVHGKPNGVYNVCSPTVVSNKDFMQTARHVMKIPFGLPSPKWLLELGSAIIQTETELVLKSRYVSPKNLLTEGFMFQFEHLEQAIQNLISDRTKNK